MLEWYNPSFDGVAPLKYEVSVFFSISRKMHKDKSASSSDGTDDKENRWVAVYYPGDIIKNSFLVRNLTMGVPVQFRVRAYNHGGWGSHSAETILVIPGEEEQPISDYLRWRKLTKGGALAILDRLDKYPDERHEHIGGLHKLCVFAQKDGGFSKGLAPIKCTLAAIYALTKFPNDEEVAIPAFLLLAWCMRGRMSDRVMKLCHQHDISARCVSYMQFFRSSTRILGSIGMLRSSFRKHHQEQQLLQARAAQSQRYSPVRTASPVHDDVVIDVPQPHALPEDDDFYNTSKRRRKRGGAQGMSALGASDYGGDDEPANDDDYDSDEDEEDEMKEAELRAGGKKVKLSKTHAIAPIIGHEEMVLLSLIKVEERKRQLQYERDHPGHKQEEEHHETVDTHQQLNPKAANAGHANAKHPAAGKAANKKTAAAATTTAAGKAKPTTTHSNNSSSASAARGAHNNSSAAAAAPVAGSPTGKAKKVVIKESK
jgi:hypothetical protein